MRDGTIADPSDALSRAAGLPEALVDGARDRGRAGRPDPRYEAHAGIGFVIDSRSRLPVRFRAGYVTDDQIVRPD